MATLLAFSGAAHIHDIPTSKMYCAGKRCFPTAKRKCILPVSLLFGLKVLNLVFISLIGQHPPFFSHFCTKAHILHDNAKI